MHVFQAWDPKHLTGPFLKSVFAWIVIKNSPLHQHIKNVFLILPPVPFGAPIIFLKTTSTNKTKHQAFGWHSCRHTQEMRCSEVWASDASAESRSANLPREEKGSKYYKTSIKFTWSEQHSKEKESHTWIQGSDPEQRLAFQMRGDSCARMDDVPNQPSRHVFIR